MPRNLPGPGEAVAAHHRARRLAWLSAGLIWLGSVAPLGGLPSPGRTDLVAHGLQFAVFAVLAARATRGRPRGLIALAASLALGVATEGSQLLAPGRHVDLADLAADLLGALAGVGLWAAVRGRGAAEWDARARGQTRDDGRS